MDHDAPARQCQHLRPRGGWAEAAQEEEQPEPLPDIPRIMPFQPRDRFGQPIKHIEEVTMAQRRALLAWPRKPELEAVAIAKEEAMMAEQQALDAKKKPSMNADERR
jgi:hypothetical protein